MLEFHRPNDINLNIAVSDTKGMEESVQFGYFLSVDDNFKHKLKENYQNVSVSELNTDTLDNIIAQHAQGKQIHFLKIDVEGHDFKVLEGLNLSKYRPWVIIIEYQYFDLDTFQEIITDSFKVGHERLLRFNYNKCYFDVIIMYYLANEHKELEKHFKAPINLTDDFIHYREHHLRQTLANIQNIIKNSKSDEEQNLNEILHKVEKTIEHANFVNPRPQSLKDFFDQWSK